VTSRLAPERKRAAYIDWTRGIAVLLMIEAHTVDSWTRASSRGSTAYGYAVMLAGFAAPLFLWLAGLSVSLAAAAGVRRGLSRAAAAENVVRRGLEIFILAFLFRLQAFILSPGAHPVTLFRVDILNIMGPAIVVTALLWLFFESTLSSAVAFSILAVAVTMSTPLVRHLGGVDALPVWLQWYVRPSGDNTTFTSFPWAGFVFAGAAVGGLLAAVRGTRAERRLLSAIGVAGVLVIAAGYYASFLPSIYADSSFWTTSPAYFAMRAGVLMTALALMFAVEQTVIAPTGALRMLARLGRSSLFVYWIHVELVYGYATWPIHRRLPLRGTLAAFLLFTLLMAAAVVLRDRLAERARRHKQQIAFQYKAEAL
jgi:uncharacterized membrane protein